MRDYLLENVIVPPQKGIHHSVPDNVVSERKEMELQTKSSTPWEVNSNKY